MGCLGSYISVTSVVDAKSSKVTLPVVPQLIVVQWQVKYVHTVAVIATGSKWIGGSRAVCAH